MAAKKQEEARSTAACARCLRPAIAAKTAADDEVETGKTGRRVLGHHTPGCQGIIRRDDPVPAGPKSTTHPAPSLRILESDQDARRGLHFDGSGAVVVGRAGLEVSLFDEGRRELRGLHGSNPFRERSICQLPGLNGGTCVTSQKSRPVATARRRAPGFANAT